MIKPWLLMANEERRDRQSLYLGLVSGTAHVDEALLVSIRPPKTALEALFELWLWQQRNKSKL